MTNVTLTATVSGSFNRHLHAIDLAVQDLGALGVRVLSPADPRIVETVGAFHFVASDEFRSIRMVEDRHLDSIRSSQFLWVVASDGYVGPSVSMEIGYAAAYKVPILTVDDVYEAKIRALVRRIDSIWSCRRYIENPRVDQGTSLLIKPHESLEVVRDSLDRIEATVRKARAPQLRDLSSVIYSDCRTATAGLRLP